MINSQPPGGSSSAAMQSRKSGRRDARFLVQTISDTRTPDPSVSCARGRRSLPDEVQPGAPPPLEPIHLVGEVLVYRSPAARPCVVVVDDEHAAAHEPRLDARQAAGHRLIPVTVDVRE